MIMKKMVLPVPTKVRNKKNDISLKTHNYTKAYVIPNFPINILFHVHFHVKVTINKRTCINTIRGATSKSSLNCFEICFEIKMVISLKKIANAIMFCLTQSLNANSMVNTETVQSSSE